MEIIKSVYFLAINLILLYVSHSVAQTVTPVAYGVNTNNPFWDYELLYLYFTDTADRSQNRYDPVSQAFDYVFTDQETDFIIPLRDGLSGYFFLGGLDRDAVYQYIDFNQGGASYFNCLVARVDRCLEGNNFAAVKADAYGRVWAGTYGAVNTQGEYLSFTGNFYRIDTTKPGVAEVELVISGLTNPAGLVWSPDNLKMYLTNYLSRTVLAYDFDLAEGTICNPIVVFSFDAANITGTPGGITIDNYGNLWIAVTGGGMVINVSPYTGEVLYAIQIPATNVTAVEFGSNNLQDLFVTSQVSPGNFTEDYAGYVFQVTGISVPSSPNLRGVPDNFVKLNSLCRPIYASPSYYDNPNST